MWDTAQTYALMLAGEAFDRFFQHQSPTCNGRHVKRHHTAAAIAVSIISHHALAFVLAGRPQGKSFQTKLTVIGYFLRLVRLHQLERRIEHVDGRWILLF